MKQQSLKLIFSLVFLLVSFGCSDCRVGAPTEETFREKVATEPRTLEEAPSSAGIAPGDQSSDQKASLQVAASRQPSHPPVRNPRQKRKQQIYLSRFRSSRSCRSLPNCKKSGIIVCQQLLV